MSLNISETARARDRVGRPAPSWLLRSSLTCCVVAAALAGSGCQLILDDIEQRDAAIVDVDADGASDASVLPTRDAASSDGGGGSPIDAAQPAQDVGSATDAEAEAAPSDATPDAARDTGSRDADPDACDGAGERVFYRDSDRDGYGNPRSFDIACTAPPGSVARGGDCHDDNDAVHPGQTAFFGAGYEIQDSNLISFDYDCDGEESGQPDQDLANPQGCEGLVPCTGAGYVASDRREVPRANDHCGSTTIITCGIGLLICTATESPADRPYLCK